MSDMKLFITNLSLRGLNTWRIFVDELSDVPVSEGEEPPIVIFSAHGVSQAVKTEAFI